MLWDHYTTSVSSLLLQNYKLVSKVCIKWCLLLEYNLTCPWNATELWQEKRNHATAVWHTNKELLYVGNGWVSQTGILYVSSNFRYFILHFKYVYFKSEFVYNSIQSILGVEKKPQEDNVIAQWRCLSAGIGSYLTWTAADPSVQIPLCSSYPR